MSLKDFPGYVFSEYCRVPLEKFLNKAKREPTSFCNVNDENFIAQVLPPEFMSVRKRTEQEGSVRNVPDDEPMCICISDSEEDPQNADTKQEDPQEDSLLLGTSIDVTLAVSRTEDLCAFIIETLDTEKCLLPGTFNDLKSLSEDQSKEIYIRLADCSSENIASFGESLLEMGFSEEVSLVQYYTEMLLIRKINQEYNSSLGKHVNSFIDRYPNIVYMSLLKKIISDETTNIKIISQYVGSMSDIHKVNILRSYLDEVDKLQENNFPLLEVLLHNNKSELDLLKKLVEIMSNEAESFSKDKTFGKLLHNVIQQLGPDAKMLEQPLKYIIGRHESIWKTKANKLFDSNFSDSLLLTQSIRF